MSTRRVTFKALPYESKQGEICRAGRTYELPLEEAQEVCNAGLAVPVYQPPVIETQTLTPVHVEKADFFAEKPFDLVVTEPPVEEESIQEVVEEAEPEEQSEPVVDPDPTPVPSPSKKKK